jgi:hypothetical protein
MEPPIYLENECINDYLRKVELYQLYLKKNDYNKILVFLNNLLNLRKECHFKSLLDLKKINYNDIFKNKNYLLDFLKKNAKIIGKEYSIDFNIKKIYNKKDIDNLYIINFINNLLHKIGYSFKEYNINKTKYYKILQK